MTETGWGEFELAIKLYFVPESGEKPQTLWHSLKIHPYGPEAEIQRIQRRPITSQNYEDVIFNEPVEPFYHILTGGPDKPLRGGKSAAKGAAAAAAAAASGSRSSLGGKSSGRGGGGSGSRTAEIPLRSSQDNPYGRDTEGKELDRITDAIKKVDELIIEERDRLAAREATLDQLRKTEGLSLIKKK